MENVELCGFVFTPDEWAILEESERSELLAAAAERDEPETAAA